MILKVKKKIKKILCVVTSKFMHLQPKLYFNINLNHVTTFYMKIYTQQGCITSNAKNNKTAQTQSILKIIESAFYNKLRRIFATWPY